ncbi:TPA: hypothetical protein I7664_20680 [Vibrio vulnificus]|nr:hypothetical protein [Vibrio vulnificus]
MINVLNLGLINISNLLLPIALIPMLVGRIGIEHLSNYMVLTTILMFGVLLSDYSFNTTATRDVIYKKDEGKSLDEYVSLVQSVKLLISLLYSIIASFLTVFFIDISLVSIFTFLLFGLLSNLYMLVWYRQAIHELKLVTIISALSKVLYFIFVYFFVKSSSDFELLIVMYSLPQFVLSIWAYTSFKYNLSLNIMYSLNFKDLLLCLKKGRDVFIGDFSPNLYNNLPAIFLGLTAGGASYASYSVSQKISNVIISFQYVISKGVFPLAVKSPQKAFKLNFILNFIVLVPSLIIVHFFSNQILSFFLDQVSQDAVNYLKLLFLSAVFTAVYNVINQNFLLPSGKDKEFRTISMYVSIISALIGVILISMYEIYGIVISLLIARFLLCFVSVLISIRIKL